MFHRLLKVFFTIKRKVFVDTKGLAFYSLDMQEQSERSE
jgi:hypothetical protein